MRRSTLTLLILGFLSGCAAGPHPSLTPYAAHPPSMEKKDTTVLIAMDRQGTPHFLATVRKIDGQDVACHWNYGCPLWARLSPGDHRFVIRYQSDLAVLSSPSQTSSQLKFVDLEVAVNDMRPTHVYVVRYLRANGAVSPTVEDMGERPKSGIMWPIGVPSATEQFADF